MAWHLVTAPDERERCMVVEDDARCERAPRWLARSARQPDGTGGEPDDYAFVCNEHLELVTGPGYLVEPAGPPARSPAHVRSVERSA
jgi:hypothetical protein